jgi:prephenate dehydrogenase
MKILVSALEHLANMHLKSVLIHLNSSYELMDTFDSSGFNLPLAKKIITKRYNLLHFISRVD